MFLLFLLTFNSATALDSDDFYIREVTTQRLSVLSVAAWPSLLLADSYGNREAVFRAEPLLWQYRKRQQIQQAVTLIDSNWPLTVTEAERLYGNYELWQAVHIVFVGRTNVGESLIVIIDPEADYWRSGDGNIFDLLRIFNGCKSIYGKGLQWPFR